MLSCLVFAVATAVCAPVRGPIPAATYVGRENQLQVRIPRIEASAAVATIDARLDEPVWQEAALLTGFSQYSPQDGIPAADSTHVLLWYSPTALYIGIRAFEAHGAVHATLAERDKITSDDHIQVLLGTFHDRRQAYVFAVNPLGVQMDGTIVEVAASGGGLAPVLPARTATDLSQDFVFTSKGRLTEYGYEIELEIPFKSLKYQSSDPQDWDINVVREVQHSGYEDTWAPARRANASFLGQSGTLEGLRGIEHGLVLDLNPVVTRKSTGGRPQGEGGAGRWTYTQPRPQFGMNARWGVTNNLTFNGTARPDFAEVESDASQIVLDPRSALFFPEKRPFFLDGLEQFSVPHSLIYTRRVAKPEAALKLTGKVAGTSVGVLSAEDDPSLSANGRYATVYNILRAQRDVGGQSRVGAAYTDRVVGGDYNRVADLDSRVVFGQVYSAALQYAESYDKTRGVTRQAPLWDGSVARNGKRFGFRYSMNGIAEDFRAQSGFISRPGVAATAIDHRVSWFNARGSALETFNLDVLGNADWQYSHLVRRGDAQNKRFHVSPSAGLRGGWTVGAGVFWESYGYDTQLYANYRIERTVGSKVDTIPFVGVGRIPNRDYIASLSTPQWPRFNATVLYIFGQDENFFEWAQANIDYLTLTTDFRPTDHLRATGTLTYQDYWRRTDHTPAGRNAIPRLKVEYQFTRSIFFRAVSEYSLSERNDLRDETRTFFPLIINGTKALATRNATFKGDWLFSYQPSPGTVLFLGYGSVASAVPDPLDRFTYQRPVRASDYFFVKYSYLFRM